MVCSSAFRFHSRIRVKGEYWSKTQPKTFHKKCDVLLNSKVIFKSIIDPDIYNYEDFLACMGQFILFIPTALTAFVRSLEVYNTVIDGYIRSTNYIEHSSYLSE